MPATYEHGDKPEVLLQLALSSRDHILETFTLWFKAWDTFFSFTFWKPHRLKWKAQTQQVNVESFLCMLSLKEKRFKMAEFSSSDCKSHQSQFKTQLKPCGHEVKSWDFHPNMDE